MLGIFGHHRFDSHSSFSRLLVEVEEGWILVSGSPTYLSYELKLIRVPPSLPPHLHPTNQQLISAYHIRIPNLLSFIDRLFRTTSVL